MIEEGTRNRKRGKGGSLDWLIVAIHWDTVDILSRCGLASICLITGQQWNDWGIYGNDDILWMLHAVCKWTYLMAMRVDKVIWTRNLLQSFQPQYMKIGVMIETCDSMTALQDFSYIITVMSLLFVSPPLSAYIHYLLSSLLYLSPPFSPPSYCRHFVPLKY